MLFGSIINSYKAINYNIIMKYLFPIFFLFQTIGLCMSETNNNDIVIVYNQMNYQQCHSLFESFQNEIKLLKPVIFKYTPDFNYSDYQNDLQTIARGFSENAELIDTRDLQGYENQPTRILLTDTFFPNSKEEKYRIILHELGHYFTNSRLISIREFIGEENPKLLNVTNPSSSMSNLLKLHNEAINNIFQIPKLIQEINAELWVFKHYPDYSEKRLNNYCADLHNSITEFKKMSPDSNFLFQIPKLNFLLLWRKLIIKHTNFSYSKNCQSQVVKLLALFDSLTVKARLNDLEIILQRQYMEKSLEYNSENIPEVKRLYKIIFKDFILHSILFFPAQLRNDIKLFYEI